jgi:membrane-bound metal-dependent hydrolase YbcI (DUF457 family)
MPSPIGHALAGLATVWTADVVTGEPSDRMMTVACVGLAMAADLDLITGGHRGVTHSLGAAVFVAIVAAAVAVRTRRPVVRVTLLCAAAYATHILLDWLGADNSFPYGLRALWPLTDRYYISGLDLFPQTARRHLMTASVVKQNLRAVGQEIAILLPIVAALWLVRVKALARFAAELSGGHHPAQ